MQCVMGQGACALGEGEYLSASVINNVVGELVPKAVGWEECLNGELEIYFFIGNFHDMEFSAAPEPVRFTSQIAELHRKEMCLNRMFGFPIPTIHGMMERTIICEKSWATSLSHQLMELIKYDSTTGTSWPKLTYEIISAIPSPSSPWINEAIVFGSTAFSLTRMILRDT